MNCNAILTSASFKTLFKFSLMQFETTSDHVEPKQVRVLLPTLPFAHVWIVTVAPSGVFGQESPFISSLSQTFSASWRKKHTELMQEKMQIYVTINKVKQYSHKVRISFTLDEQQGRLYGIKTFTRLYKNVLPEITGIFTFALFSCPLLFRKVTLTVLLFWQKLTLNVYTRRFPSAVK